MERWAQVVEKVLRPWRNDVRLLAALLYGSHVDGTAVSADSDIDLLFVVSDDAGTAPALCYLDGFLVESFFLTPAKVRAAFAQHHRENTRVTPVQWTSGQVLVDRVGTAAALRVEARQWLDKPFEMPPEPALYWMRRRLWQGMLHLGKIYNRRGADFTFVAQSHLHTVYVTYARFLRQPVNDPHRVYAALTDASLRRRYHQDELPDPAFAAGFIAAIEETRPAQLMALAQGLTDHVLARMGGFEVPTCSG